MRTLNRPMFRYGGPIKEGVMNGIREPRRNGGSMGKTLLVGQHPAQFKDAGGREQHWAPLVYGLAAAGRMLARPFGSWAMKQMAKKGVTGGGGIIRSGLGRSRVMQPGESLTQSVNKFTPNWLGKQFINDPLAKSVMTGSNKFGKGIQWTGKKIGGIGKYAFGSPSGLLFMGLPVTYHAGKYFLSDGKEITGKNLNKITQGEKRGVSGAPGGGDPDMTYTAPEKELTEAEIKAIEAENRIKQMEKYKEIMDIKGMSKNAAYKSLVDASKIIQEGGNLKEQLKSGSLISKLTQAASKRFDKVSDTESALRSLVAKGEIDKELNKDKNKLDNAVKNAQLEAYTKQNKGLTTAEIIKKRMLTATGEMPQGDALRTLISINNPGLNAKTLPSGKMKQGQDPLEYITQVITAVNKDPKTPDYPEGIYVIKDTIIKVIDGNVIPIPINALN
jgi:hypothetical protein